VIIYCLRITPWPPVTRETPLGGLHRLASPPKKLHRFRHTSHKISIPTRSAGPCVANRVAGNRDKQQNTIFYPGSRRFRTDTCPNLPTNLSAIAPQRIPAQRISQHNNSRYTTDHANEFMIAICEPNSAFCLNSFSRVCSREPTLRKCASRRILLPIRCL
jgi:hypothetical protein